MLAGFAFGFGVIAATGFGNGRAGQHGERKRGNNEGLDQLHTVYNLSFPV